MKSPRKNYQVLEPLQVRNTNKNQVLTTAPLIDRGLNVDECKVLCNSPIIPIREKAFFRVIYVTGLRAMEALNLRIENFDKDTGELVALRTKGKKNKYLVEEIVKPRHVIVSLHTVLKLKSIISNRKKGYTFEGEHGRPLTKRFMQAQIDNYAKLLSIQKIRRYLWLSARKENATMTLMEGIQAYLPSPAVTP